MKKFIIPILFCFTVHCGFAQKATNMSTPKVAPNGTMNFSVMDNAPQFKGCENTGSKREKNKCTSQKIENFIQEAFNKNVASTIPSNSENISVYIRFIVNTNGGIENVGVRTNNPVLLKEVERIVKTLPNFSRGTHQGMNINASYAVTLESNKLLNRTR
ncbi:hypothetical protein KORDIASMS9_01927 [Kordia sp. SMS9]|uniref:hypothetical protein n=1 Tax=Kordia sp. SMS9 TaxID=2282170 RepID=UPI000E107974|nr:hypothetical protein [Kordia sp. SMS9]AXG69700.1 hypothetical protein KORDIASMS9_01927 [Kordia sp. SMS9]